MRSTTHLWLGLAALLGTQPAGAQDFAAGQAEVVRHLQALVRLDTSNPPGNETRAADYLKGVLEKEGIPAEIFELEPGRGNVVARLKGSGKKRPILLLGHIDVVGVEREKWTVDPFAAVIKDGYVYGRGASDDKGMVAAALQVVLMLHRQKVPLDRDVIFLAEAGEEGTPRFGVEYMIAQHWDKIDAEFALNEGGEIHLQNGKVQYVGVSTTEKVPRGMRLTARGSSGHGSQPRMDNAIVHLAAAVAKLGEYQPPMRLNETTRAFFERLAKISPPEAARWYTHLDDPAVQQQLRESDIRSNSMLRTTISPNIIKGGFRSNVIPGDAEATLDIRALPDEDMEKFTAQLRQLIDDPAIELVPASGGRPVTPPSPLGSELFLALERAQAKVFPGAVTLPIMLTGATDSAQLRAKGVQAYGIGSVSSDDDRSRVHGNDERMSVDGLGQFLRYMHTVVVDVAGAK